DERNPAALDAGEHGMPGPGAGNALHQVLLGMLDKIEPGTEMRPVGAQDGDLRLGRGAVDGSAEVGDRRVVERVALVRTVQRQDGDVLLKRIVHQSHVVTFPWSAAPSWAPHCSLLNCYQMNYFCRDTSSQDEVHR